MAGEQKSGGQLLGASGVTELFDLRGANARGLLQHDPAITGEKYSRNIDGQGDLFLICGLDFKAKTAATIIGGHEAEIPDFSFAV